MKSVKCRRGGRFNLVLGIIVGIIAGIACAIRWLVSTDGDTWLRETTKSLMGEERQLMSPEMVETVQKYLTNEYILIALIAAAALIVLAIIFFIAASACRKKEERLAYEEDMNADSVVYYEETADVEPAPASAPVKNTSDINLWVQLKKVRSVDDVKALQMAVKEKLAEEKVQKVVRVVVPAATACIVTAAIASVATTTAKTKRRNQFYRWLG